MKSAFIVTKIEITFGVITVNGLPHISINETDLVNVIHSCPEHISKLSEAIRKLKWKAEGSERLISVDEFAEVVIPVAKKVSTEKVEVLILYERRYVEAT